MPGPSGESCGACYFGAIIPDGNLLGFCLRYPPCPKTRTKVGESDDWPVVTINSWCGEFKPLPEGTNE